MPSPNTLTRGGKEWASQKKVKLAFDSIFSPSTTREGNQQGRTQHLLLAADIVSSLWQIDSDKAFFL